jgi:hypothetical protein
MRQRLHDLIASLMSGATPLRLRKTCSFQIIKELVCDTKVRVLRPAVDRIFRKTAARRSLLLPDVRYWHPADIQSMPTNARLARSATRGRCSRGGTRFESLSESTDAQGPRAIEASSAGEVTATMLTCLDIHSRRVNFLQTGNFQISYELVCDT